MPWLYTVEQGKNTGRSDACELWFLFQFLDMNFSAVNLKPTRILPWLSRTLKWFLFCCLRLSCASYVMGRMLRKDYKILKTRSQKTIKWKEWNNKSLIWLFTILYMWTFLLSIFDINKFFFKKFLQVYHFWILEIHHCTHFRN